MKSKRKILSFAIAAVLAATAAISVSAAELTESTPDGSAEVTAHIDGAGPGDVSYIITVPDKVDFGALTQPEDNSDSYKDVEYSVTATEINNLSESQWVTVRVKDKDADLENDQFYITQKTEPYTKFTYDVYDETSAVNTGDMGDNGYMLVAFNQTGQTLNGKLRLNQNQLYGKDLSTIAGDYSGYMVFHSSITTA